jgi:hypothetical protein
MLAWRYQIQKCQTSWKILESNQIPHLNEADWYTEPFQARNLEKGTI